MHFLNVPGYTPIKPLNKGGMTDLVLSKDEKDQTVLLRSINLAHLNDKIVRSAFILGIEALSNMNHPNIIKILDHGQILKTPYMVIAFHENAQNLREMISSRSETLQNYSFEFMRQIVKALTHIHTQGYLHMDLKPENIIVTEENQLIILDFDFSMPHKSKVQKLKHVPGTMGYLAPETLLKRKVSTASEIFTMGVVLYELLTGKKPFRGDSLAQVRKRVTDMQDEICDLNQLRPDLPSELVQIVHKCLAKNTDERYPSMSLIYRDLEALV